MTTTAPKPRPLIGWREWVTLSELSPSPLKAKVDTGALTAALHAFDLTLVERDGLTVARFEVHPRQRSAASATMVECPVIGFRRVRSSTGHAERRPLIKTPVRIGGTKFNIDITLTSRDEMGFRMLLGRAAIRRRFWVDSSRSYLLGERPDKEGTR